MTGLIPVEEAISRLIAERPPRVPIRLPLAEALGTVLAEDIRAGISRPPASVSAMDGYAVKFTDVAAGGAQLVVIGEAPAGTPFSGGVNSGEAVRIFTGGEMPGGTDHVVIQEDTAREGDTVICHEAYSQPQSVRAEGIDFKRGDTILSAGQRVGPAEIAMAAAANQAELNVWRRPIVALLANGDELRPPGSTLKRGEIVSSNAAGLAALIRAWGGEPVDLGIAADSIASIQDHIAKASAANIIVPVGGASVGDHDHMRAAIAEAGYEQIFQKIAVKPGKPTWFSQKGDQKVLGLPGNPASAFVCAHLFLKPLMSASDGPEIAHAQLRGTLKANGPRETYMRAHATPDAGGILKIAPMPDQDSSLMSPFLSANALIKRRAHASACAAGDVTEFVWL